jgi:hypothetical protein
MRCLLIGGASHVGKSTLAAAWGEASGWPVVATDRLGRHPGRPWPMEGRVVPPHVVEHYRSLSDEALLASNLEHYRSMWPLIETLAAAHLAAPLGRLIIEGSGCWPDHMVEGSLEAAAAVWLVAPDDLIAQRTRRESGYAAADADARETIDRFIARSLRFNSRLEARLGELGLPATRIRPDESPLELMSRCSDGLFRL